MSFINDHIDYITSLTDQSSELIEAIQAKNGTFVLYGNGNNGKSTFIKFLGKHQHLVPGIHQSMKWYVDGFVVEDPTHIDYQATYKIWYLTNTLPSGKYIHFNHTFSDPMFEI